MQFKCPKCKKPISGHEKKDTTDKENGGLGKYFPFCSERCKLLDIGAWLDGDYNIPIVENTEPEAD
ncbi:MAG: DNA gyrase inhibitor YacG [Anaerohalosphaera sp.]|nr:DNA gyrase inhibitor YacG [Anaerohalosphaera sp.]